MKPPTANSEKSRRGYKSSNGKRVVNVMLLAPNSSYSDDKPGFLIRGFYQDEPFTCRDCGSSEIWTASQQKWWFELAKGEIFTKASRCRACRRKERIRREAARRIHLEGLAAKEKKT